MKDRILIIDGSSLFFRAFYALPLLKTKKGLYTNAIYGFVMMLENAIDKVNPDSLVVCFDMKGGTFRNELYPDYKGTRAKTPTELEQQFPLVRDILKLMNIKVLESPEFEADDIAGTIAKQSEEAGYEVYIITGDRDYFQLVDNNVTVLYTKKGIKEMDVITVDKIKEDYDINPLQFIELKALMGDKSDNIPGIDGIGEKTGLKLIHQFKTLENLYNNLEDVSGKKLKEKLEEGKQNAFISRKLGEIVRNVPLETSLEDYRKKEYDYEKLSEMYREFEFFSLLERLPVEYQTEEIIKASEEIFEWEDKTADELISDINRDGFFSFKFITDGKIYEGNDPIYLAIKSKNSNVSFVRIFNIENILDFKDVFENENIKKSGYEIKEDIIILQSLGIDIKNVIHDCVIAEYLLNSTQSNYDINNISNTYFSVGYLDNEELLGKGAKRKEYKDLSVEELKKYFAFYLNTVEKLTDVQINKISEQEMTDLYYKVELPIAEVLSSMELKGIRTDEKVLDEIGTSLDEKILNIEKNIYNEAGLTFNINSPKVLGEVLFEKMGFPVIKKTKTGYSTAADVLEKLRGNGDIIDNILEYRKLTKLKSTYVDGLKQLINPKTGRIHSHFNQTVTSTGRISSTEPNLQNIPIRTEEGKLIRKSFLASNNSKLVDADYSQIELRVLASLSEDVNMIDAFIDDDDIHRRTASEVFHVPLKEVTSDLRSQAKAVNFGIVYGISDYGLSQNLNIPRKEAAKYIDEYLKHYSGIKEYMDSEIKEARDKGYVKTLLNRRRYIPELNAKNFNIRSFGERVALNTPIQGTAADIIKIAMVEIYRAFKKQGLKSSLILQIHDELVVDAVEDEVEIVEKLMRDIMESALVLKVPLKIDMKSGNSLYETK